MRKIFIYSIIAPLFFIGTHIETNAQQVAMYSQYMFNNFMLNPAYAGSRRAFSTSLSYRNQWTGIDGSPNTSSFSLHSGIAGKRVGLGLNVLTDEIGPSSSTIAMGTYAYHLPFSKGKLSMGLRAGIYNFKFDPMTLDFKNPDYLQNSAQERGIIPSFDFGIYYYTYNLYVGVSSTHITQNEKSHFSNEDYLHLLRHYIAIAGYAYPISNNLVLKPSTMVKYVDGAPLSVDLNMSCLINKKLWLGVSYRSSNNLVWITELNIAQFIRIGYSYDFGFNQLQKYSNGSHELFLGADFKLKKIDTPGRDTRYF